MCDMLYISINTYLSLLCLSSGLSSFIKEGWRLNRLLRLCLPFISTVFFPILFFTCRSKGSMQSRLIFYMVDDMMTPQEKGCSNQYLELEEDENYFNKLWFWLILRYSNGSAYNKIEIWFWHFRIKEQWFIGLEIHSTILLWWKSFRCFNDTHFK